MEVEFGGCRRLDEMFTQGDIRRQCPLEGAPTISEDAGGARTPKIRASAADSGEGIIDIPAVNDDVPHEWVPSLGICNIQRPELRQLLALIAVLVCELNQKLHTGFPQHLRSLRANSHRFEYETQVNTRARRETQ
jgi:hypothetical protein